MLGLPLVHPQLQPAMAKHDQRVCLCTYAHTLRRLHLFI
jgi:hypothetical protein